MVQLSGGTWEAQYRDGRGKRWKLCWHFIVSCQKLATLLHAFYSRLTLCHLFQDDCLRHDVIQWLCVRDQTHSQVRASVLMSNAAMLHSCEFERENHQNWQGKSLAKGCKVHLARALAIYWFLCNSCMESCDIPTEPNYQCQVQHRLIEAHGDTTML